MSNDKINWAILSPETRLYKGINIFRWDVSPGLEHHCGTCATPLRNARAKTTCLGKHVEPCYRFHQQLHFVGKSHECFSCNASDEIHHNRHKEILACIRKIKIIDQGDPDNPIGILVGFTVEERRDSIATTATATTATTTTTATTATTPTDASSETVPVEEVKMTRRERKRAKKLGNSASKDKNNTGVFYKEELDFVSEAIHMVKHETKGAWAGTYHYGDQQAEAPVVEAKEEETAVDDEDAGEIMEQPEDFSVKPMALMTPKQRKNLQKYTAQYGQANYRDRSRRYSSGLMNGIYDGLDPQIFFRLGVEIANPPRDSRERRDLAAKLIALVKEDIEILEKEESEAAMRKEGFWRWAGKPAFNSILRNREEVDWATGQRIGSVRRGSASAAYQADEDAAEAQGVATEAEETDTEAPGAMEDIEEEPPTTPSRTTAGPRKMAIPNRTNLPNSEDKFDPAKTERLREDAKNPPAARGDCSELRTSNIEDDIQALDELGGTKDNSPKLKGKPPDVPKISVTTWGRDNSPRVLEIELSDLVRKPIAAVKAEERGAVDHHDGVAAWSGAEKPAAVFKAEKRAAAAAIMNHRDEGSRSTVKKPPTAFRAERKVVADRHNENVWPSVKKPGATFKAEKKVTTDQKDEGAWSAVKKPAAVFEAEKKVAIDQGDEGAWSSVRKGKGARPMEAPKKPGVGTLNSVFKMPRD